MKRVAALLLALITIISFSSCSGKRENVKYSPKSSNEQNENENKNFKQNTNQNTIDPFDGLSVEFGGVSPFCSVAFDESKCSDVVQNNVQFSLEPDKITIDNKYKKGDTVTVYASLRNVYSEEVTYSIYPTSKTYKVEDVPEYLTSLDDTDLSKLETELADKLTAYTAWSQGHIALDVYEYISHSDLQRTAVYFSSLKTNQYSNLGTYDYPHFNCLDFVYSVKILDRYNNQNVRSFTLQAKNLVKYPDGTIGWGEKDPLSLDFQDGIANNQNDLVNEQVFSNSAGYNISKVENIFQK